ncbi:MAG: 2-oxo acid dehydrogenase subunit E2 [Anaerolineae bacterium]|nr:2-oxo acid dehydrogenase subunit E2 [Anaerolineae bacterium]
MATEVILPKLGETMEEGVIVEWLKKEGDPVQRGEVLFTIESDKATLEVEAPTKGYLRKILVPAGQPVPVLTVVGLITRTADEPLELEPVKMEAQPQAPEAAEVEARPQAAAEQPPGAPSRIFASPRARRLARERGVDLAALTGTGPDGRIVERDVQAYLEQVPDATPVARRLAEQAGIDLRTIVGTGPGGRITREDVERAIASPPPPPPPVAPPSVPVASPPVKEAAAVAEVPLAGVRAVIARNMHASHQTTAPVTLTTEADATALVNLRERLKTLLADGLGFNIGYNDLLILLAARALREYPYINARLERNADGSEVIRHLEEIHIGLAVDTERGLLVPVVRNADRKGLVEIARELRELIARARQGKALPDELTGSTFTITNLGIHEIDAFTPIINLPEVAILGVGRIKPRPAVVDGQVCVRQTVWLSLTFDHRLVDGAPAARFLQRIKQLVEEPYLLLA